MTQLLFRRALRLASALFIFLATPSVAQSLLVIENPADRITYGKTFTLIDGFAASDGVPLFYLTEDPWPVAANPHPGVNFGYASARSALGARVGPTTIDYFFRRDWWMEGSAGALRYYELSRQKQRVGSGQTLDLEYSWQGFDADGLRVSFADRVDLWNERDTVFGLSLAALRLHQVRRESGRGRFAGDRLQSQREIWFSNFSPSNSSGGLTEFNPSFVRAVPSNGYGFSIDAGLRYDFGLGSTLRFAATDLFSYLKWGSVPHINQTADIQATAESDLVGPIPGPGISISQTSTYDTLRFRLPPKILLALDYAPTYRWRLHGESVWYRDEQFLLFGTSMRINHALSLRTDYDLRWKTIGLNLDYRRFSFGLRTDKFSPHRAQAGGATLHFEFDY